MRISLSKKDLVWNYIGVVFRLGVNFFLLPFLLRFLGDDDLGLWYVFIAVGSVASLLQLGFAPAVARNFAYCLAGAKDLARNGVLEAEADGAVSWSLFANVFFVSRKIYALISGIALVVLATVGTFYVSSVSGGEVTHAAPIWLLYAVGVFFNLFFTYFESALRGMGCFAEINKSLVFSVLCQLVLSGALLWCGLGLVGPVIGYVAQGATYRLFCSHYFWGFREVSENLGGGSMRCYSDSAWQKRLYKAISPNAYRDGLVMLSNYLVSQSNTLICASFLSLADTGTYSLATQLVNAVANFASVYANSAHPTLQSAFASGDVVREKELVAKSTAAYLVLFAVCGVGVCFVVMPLVVLIRPSYSLSLPVLTLMLVHYLFWKQATNFAAFISNRNEVPYIKAFIAFAVIGTALSAALSALGFGIWGLIVGQLVSQMVFNNWYWIRYVCRWFGCGYIALLREGFGKLLHNS